MEKYFSKEQMRRAISAGLSIGYDNAFTISNRATIIDKVMDDVFLKESQLDDAAVKTLEYIDERLKYFEIYFKDLYGAEKELCWLKIKSYREIQGFIMGQLK